ncbi:MAG: phosphotransferase [Deltaproteobacteria bacterium]|nr:phosphotransferase [Deltaproteobacteria bacterium]
MKEVSHNAMREAAVEAAGEWSLGAVTLRGDLPVSGSPRRSEFRCVVECPDNQLVVLEAIRRQDRDKKQAVIDRLDFLSRQGLPGVHPYIRTPDGRQIVRIRGRLWQASCYVPGKPLNRPGYAFDGWRGEAMADFLINLRKTSRNLPEDISTPTFSIQGYVETLTGRIRVREPVLFASAVPVIAFLQERLAHVHDLLSVAFCHGDYHPLNMIWSDDAIQSVIDWEFSGIKPENYDAATLVGCMGMENPDALAGPLVMKFIRTLQESQVFSGSGWSVLVEMIVAIRFAWLAEWLRNRDTEMIELETVYMNLLKDNADDLAALWHC